jgi:hypothetical protein
MLPPTARENSAAVPIERAAIAIHVAVLAAQFSAFVTRGGIISAVEVATQLAAIVCNFSLVMADIAPQTSVTIPGQRGRNTHSHQQENPSNRAFHLISSDRNSRSLD